MSREPGRQALTLICRVRSGARAALVADLAQLKEPLERAFCALPSLHFARLLLLPSAEPEPELLLELCFDGLLAPLLAALWLRGESALTRLLRHCESTEALDDVAAFQRFAARHALRAEAAYVAREELSAQVIKRDAALEYLLQTELDRAQPHEALAAHGPLEIALDLQARARAASVALLNPPERERERERAPGLGCLEPIRWRFLDVLSLAVLLPLLELWQWLRALWGRAPALTAAAADSSALRAPGAVAQLLVVKPGALRLHLLRVLLWLTHGWLRQPARAHDGALSHMHDLRWLLLPGSRLLLLAHTDVAPASLLARRGPLERRLSSLIWRQTVGFPAGIGAALWGSRREAALLSWLGATLLTSEVSYSAYSWLTVAQIERNRRVQELLSAELDRERARELCQLL